MLPEGSRHRDRRFAACQTGTRQDLLSLQKHSINEHCVTFPLRRLGQSDSALKAASQRPNAVTTTSAELAKSDRIKATNNLLCALPCIAVTSSPRSATLLIPGHLPGNPETRECVG